MDRFSYFALYRAWGLLGIILLVSASVSLAQTLKEPALNQIPPEYQNKHMPPGWWTDPKIIAEGKELYDGLQNAMVACFTCHGPDGKPMLPEARDLRDPAYVGKMTDSYWFWRVSEGVPNTPMQGFKKLLKENKIWMVIAYQHTFSHGGKPEEHAHE
jgi:mono/diheme cytochrome c family protein